MSTARIHTVGFVLHGRPFRDNSRVLELLTEAEGRTACLHRGRIGTGRAFVRYELVWQGRGELKSLSLMEEQATFRLSPDRLSCGFYLNELTLKLLPSHIPMEDTVAQYEQALRRLTDAGSPVEPPLRRYELHLLRHLGEGLESLDVRALEAGQCYVYEAQSGLRPASGAERACGAFIRGAALQALLEDRLETREACREAKHLLRGLLDYHLQGRTIASRTLLRPRASDHLSTHGDVSGHDS